MTPRQARELRAALAMMDRDWNRVPIETKAIRDVVRILAREALEAAEVWDQQIGDRG